MQKAHKKIKYMKKVETISDDVHKLETEMQLQALRDHEMLEIFKYKIESPLKNSLRAAQEHSFKLNKFSNFPKLFGFEDKKKNIRCLDIDSHHNYHRYNILSESKQEVHDRKHSRQPVGKSTRTRNMMGTNRDQKWDAKRIRGGEIKSDTDLKESAKSDNNISSVVDTDDKNKKLGKKIFRRKTSKKKSSVSFKEPPNKQNGPPENDTQYEIISTDVVEPSSSSDTLIEPSSLDERGEQVENIVRIRGIEDKSSGILVNISQPYGPVTRHTDTLRRPKRFRSIAINVENDSSCKLGYTDLIINRKFETHNINPHCRPGVIFRRGDSMESSSFSRPVSRQNVRRQSISDKTPGILQNLWDDTVFMGNIRVDRAVQTDLTRLESVKERFFRIPSRLPERLWEPKLSLSDTENRLAGGANNRATQTEQLYVDSPIPSEQFKQIPSDLKYSKETIIKSPDKDSSRSDFDSDRTGGKSKQKKELKRSVSEIDEEFLKKGQISDFEESRAKESKIDTKSAPVPAYQKMTAEIRQNSDSEIVSRGSKTPGTSRSQRMGNERNTDEGLSRDDSVELNPQDAIDQIKGDCWDSELLLLITPFDKDTFDEATQLQVHAIDRIYKKHLGSFCLPKTQLRVLEKTGIFQKYCIFLTSRSIDIDKELEPIIHHTRNLIDKSCCCEIKDFPKSSSPGVNETFQNINSRRVYADELDVLLKLAEENKFNIYARPDFNSKDNVYILDFFTERNNFLGTVSAKYDVILAELSKHKDVMPNFNIILDVNELILPSRLREFLSSMASCLGLMYFYDKLGSLLFEIYKRFA